MFKLANSYPVTQLSGLYSDQLDMKSNINHSHTLTKEGDRANLNNQDRLVNLQGSTTTRTSSSDVKLERITNYYWELLEN